MASWLATLLIAVAGSMLGRALFQLGVGWVVFEGFTELADQLADAAAGSYGDLPAGVIAIASMAGFGVAFGIILAAMAAKAGMWGLARMGKTLAETT
jgi:hypothetical protein